LNITAGLLALVVLGANDPVPADPPVSYQIRFVEMKGLEWRGQLHSRMTPVARQGNATVWSAPAEVIANVTKAADKVNATPRVTSNAETPAIIRVGNGRAIVADLKRVADGPVDHAMAVAFQPEIGEVNDQLQISVSSRRIDQGMLARLCVEDAHVARVHTFDIKETVKDAKGGRPAEIHGQVQVPELISGRVEGEWLIPKDGALIVSLGAFTSADEDGKAVVRERVALIEAHSVAPSDPEATKASFSPVAPQLGVIRSVVAANPPLPPVPIGRSTLVAAVRPPTDAKAPTAPGLLLPPLPRDLAAVPNSEMPLPPSRALPVPLAADGSAVDLPPLPDDEVAEDKAASNEARPAPQTRVRPQLTSTEYAPNPATCPSDSSKNSDLVSSLARQIHASVVLAHPTKAAACPVGDEKSACCADERGDCPIREITLAEAIRTSLVNSSTVRIVEKSCPECPKDQALVCVAAPGLAPSAFKADLLAHLRAVEQQYWALHMAQVQLKACQGAEDQITEILKREKAKPVSRGPNIAEAEEQLERFRLDLIDKSATLRDTERQLRNLLGFCPHDTTWLVATSEPNTQSPLPDKSFVDLLTRVDEVATSTSSPTSTVTAAGSTAKCDHDECSKEAMRAEYQRARIAQNIESSFTLYTKAVQIKKAACVRLEAQRAYYEDGSISIDRYLESVRNVTSAACQEVEFLCRYNTALAARDESTGRLLDRWHVVVAKRADSDSNSEDSAAQRTQFSTGTQEKARLVRQSFRLPMGVLRIEVHSLKPAKPAHAACDGECPTEK
jgi:hypothetical protein